MVSRVPFLGTGVLCLLVSIFTSTAQISTTTGSEEIADKLQGTAKELFTSNRAEISPESERLLRYFILDGTRNLGPVPGNSEVQRAETHLRRFV